MTDNSIPDASLHFVRWVKGTDRGCSIRKVSQRTMHVASKMSDLSEPLDDDDSGIFVEPRRTRSQQSNWQVLKDVGGIEMMYSSSPIQTV